MSRLVSWFTAFALLVMPGAAAITAPSSPAKQGSVRQVPVGDFGMIIYDSHIPTPDSKRFNDVILALYDWYEDYIRETLPDYPYELEPPRTNFHIMKYQAFLGTLRPWKSEEEWEMIMEGQASKRKLTMGFYTRDPQSLEVNIYWYDYPDDEDVVHEMLHAIRDQLGMGGAVYDLVNSFMTSRYYKDVISQSY